MFRNRVHAGTLLAQRLSSYRGTQSIVFGLPHGGVVVGIPVANFLDLPFDVLVVKKIGSPNNSELAIGAVAPDGIFFVDQKMAATVGADEQYIRIQKEELNDQIKLKTNLYQKNKTQRIVRWKTAIIVDDGAATGATMFAAIKWLQKKKAARIVVALPVAPLDTAEKLKSMVEDSIILETPEKFSAVGQFYKQFFQVSDEEVVELLRRDIHPGFHPDV